MSQLDWGHYERLRPAQIEDVLSHTPVAYLPWGALEWHGVHAPVGLDGLQAHGQCVALARSVGGIVLPPVYVGTDTIKAFKGFPHTVEHSDEVVALLCMEFLRQLAEEGFRVIVIVTGHCGAGHTEALGRAVGVFKGGEPDVGVWLVPAFEPIKDRYPANHAARGETSFLLHFDPEPVGPPPTLDDDGVWGEDPRLASAEEGWAMTELFVARARPTILKLLTRFAR